MNQMFDFSFRVNRENYIIGSLSTLFTSIGLAGQVVDNFKIESSKDLAIFMVAVLMNFSLSRMYMSASSNVIKFLLN